MPRISTRGKNVPLSPFRKLIPIANAAKAKGRKVYHLNIGQPDIPTPPQAIKALQEADIEILAYSPAVGITSYRERLVEYYQRFDIQTDISNIIVTTGASEAIQLLCWACFDHEDEMIVPEPFYANYNGFAHNADVVIQPITCDIDSGFALPKIADFERMITPRTKAIFITNPNNPTGCFYSEEVLRQLGALVKEYDLYLVVDEVYREFCYDGQEFFSVLNIEGLEDNVIVVDSVSKRYSACGARIGAVVTRNQELLTTLDRYAKLRLSPPGLGQILAEAMIETDGDYIKEVKVEYDNRRMVVYERLKKMKGVKNYKPGGAFYCFAEFPIQDSDDFCKWLLTDFEHKNSTVMLSPGSGFYATAGLGQNQVRIAYVLNSDDLHAAMDCLEIALARYVKEVEQKENVLSI